jgi:hypothetical protein
MVTAAILVFPDWEKTFHFHVDASVITLGAILAQPREGESKQSYSICWQKIVRVGTKLQYHRERRLSYGLCTSEVQTLLIGKKFQDVYRPFISQIPRQQASVGVDNLYMVIVVPET